MNVCAGPLAPLYYSGQFVPLIVFFLLFLSIVKNNKLHHFVRFHTMQVSAPTSPCKSKAAASMPKSGFLPPWGAGCCCLECHWHKAIGTNIVQQDTQNSCERFAVAELLVCYPLRLHDSLSGCTWPWRASWNAPKRHCGGVGLGSMARTVSVILFLFQGTKLDTVSMLTKLQLALRFLH